MRHKLVTGLIPGGSHEISYGEVQDRQVRPGKLGPDGADNRRVALAVDYSGTPAAPGAMPQQPMTPDQSQPPPTGQS